MTTINFNNKNTKTLFQSLIKFTDGKRIQVTGYYKFTFKDGKLYVVASDLETFVTAEITSDIAVVESSDVTTFCIDAAEFLDAIKSTDDFDTFTLSVESGTDGRVTITTPDYKQNVNSESAESYPNTPDVSDNPRTEFIPLSCITDVLPTAIKFVGKDELRPAIMGINFDFSIKSEHLTIAATDAFTLYANNIKLNIVSGRGDEEHKSFTMPSTFATKLLNIVSYSNKASKKSNSDTIMLKFNDKSIEFTYGNFTIVGRCIDERYPNYQQIIPSDDRTYWTFKVQSESVLDAIKRVIGKANPNTNKMDLTLTSGGAAELYACDLDLNREAKKTISSCTIKSLHPNDTGKFEISFNGKLVEKILKDAVDSKEVTFCFSNASNAFLVKQESQPDATLLCMPMFRY